MDLEDRIYRRLEIENDTTLDDPHGHKGAAHIATLEAEDSTTDGQNALDAEAYARGLRPLVLAEPDLQALTAAGLQIPTETDVQGPVTRAGEPAVVVGGRYVVGENPTYRAGLGSVEELGDAAGLSVVVTDRASSDGDVFVEQVDGNDEFWIDPRHLTPAPEPAEHPSNPDMLAAKMLGVCWHSPTSDRWPCTPAPEPAADPETFCQDCRAGTASSEHHEQCETLSSSPPEPAAAPAVDDDLLRYVGQVLVQVSPRMTYRELGAWFIHSDAGQRLRAAWTADQQLTIRSLGRSTVELERERDEARAAAKEAEWGWDQATEAWGQVRAVLPPQPLERSSSLLQDTLDHIAALTAEVERLRAAQQLPDVGPVTRDQHGLLTCGPEAGWYCQITAPDRLRMFAARYLAVAAFLDAEAADTSSDDEDVLPDPEDLAEVVAALDEEFGSPSRNVTWADVVREIDAHRARGGQEAGQ